MPYLITLLSCLFSLSLFAGPSSYMPVDIHKDFKSVVDQMSVAKAGIN
jgi:hypothetical protein